MNTLDSLVGELHIVNGQRQESTPFSGAFSAPRRSARGRQDDALFILADPSGSHPLIPDLIERIQLAFWRVPGSVTAALRTAIEAGNEWLLERNQNAVAKTRAALTCIVLRGSEIFIAQAGAASAYIAHQGQLQRFPARDTDNNPPALGVARVIEVRFSHAELHHGDVLLLVNAAFPLRLPDEALASAIVYVGVETALANLQRLADKDSLTSMLIEVSASSETHDDAESSAQQPTAHVSEEGVATRASEWLAAFRQGLSRSAGSLGAGARTLLERILPDRGARQGTHGGARRSMTRTSTSTAQNTRLMAVLAVGIPLLVAIVVTAVFVERSTSARVDALLDEAQQLLATTNQSVSAEEQRARWESILNKANEALTLVSDNADAIDIRNQAFAQLDRLDGTLRVSPLLIHDFTTTGARVGQFRLATQGTYIFILDMSEGRVDRLSLDDATAGNEPVPAVVKGITVGGRVVGDLIDMAWVDAFGARQKSALIVLERGGLVEYDLAFDPSTIPFADSTVPSGARRLDSFDGNLYLLDVNARQVWRYRPSADGYSGLPEGYFETTPAGIENAIDIAIDGNIYILEAGGIVHKYVAGTELPFELSGLPMPITRPVAAAVDAETPTASGLYIADLDGARIVHVRPDGQYIRQVRSVGPEFDAIQDLLVDERAQRLYVISAGKLYSTALPPAP